MVLSNIFSWGDGVFLAGSRDDFATTIGERIALIAFFAGSGRSCSSKLFATIGGRIKVVAGLAAFSAGGSGGLDAVAGAGVNYFALFTTLEGLVDVSGGRRGVVCALSAIGAKRSIRSATFLLFVVVGGGDGLLFRINDFDLERLGGALS